MIENFSEYLKSLREPLGMSLNKVCGTIKNLFTNSDYHITPSHLHYAEKGTNRLLPLKLKALAKVYGIKPGEMLFKAGYLDEDPTIAPKDWEQETLRDYYLASLSNERRSRPLTEREKRIIENAFLEIIQQSSKHEPSDWIYKIFLNIYLDHLTTSRHKKMLTKIQRETLENFIDEYISTFAKKE